MLSLHLWIVAIAVLSALPCAMLGNYLVLRRMSMMGDAITHAVLPGIAVAFLLSETRSGPVLFLGAIGAGLLTTLFTQWIQNFGRVDRGAAMGVVFTLLFALGLIVIRQTADHVDLDPDCVLYGDIELAPFDTVELGAWHIPRAALVLTGVLALNILCVGFFYKEFKLSSFDPALATTLGIPANLFHYLLMVLVSVTTVAAFEAIGSILVVAMLIVPAASAYLLTDRLGTMIVLSLILAALSAVFGHLGAITLPKLLGVEDTKTAGMMAVAAGFFFTLCLFLGPRQGIVSRWLNRLALARRIGLEDALGLLYRMEESALSAEQAQAALQHSGTPLISLKRLERSGRVRQEAGAWHLTDQGRREARHLVRSHRLWETYLHQFLQLPTDHVDPAAHRLEHVTSAEMRDRLARRTGEKPTDPQGKSIPPEEDTF